jgi:YHS domain-containing protein
MTRDPVCGMQVDEKQAKAQIQHQGQTYYFCSDQCKQRFEENPKRFVKKSA